MSINLALILTVLTAVTGIVVLLNRLVYEKKVEATGASNHLIDTIVEYSRSFFPVLLFVLVVRSFIFEPFRIPSGSMMPTLIDGDYIFVKKYSLIIGLHGKNDNPVNGKQTGAFRVFTKKEAYEKNPAILLAPLCYKPFGQTGGGWHKKPGGQAVDLIKDILKKLPLADEDRVYLWGYSMGGGGTAKLISDEPKLFAAGIIIAGWVEQNEAKVFKKVPVWAFHGSDDDIVEPGSIRKTARTLERSKIFKYTEFEGKGHGIVSDTLKHPGLIDWLFEQQKKK